jgi:chromosomal replication initiator protein
MLSVAVPSTFASEHLRQRFGELARIAVSEVLGLSAEIRFVVREVTGPKNQTTKQTSANATSVRKRRGTRGSSVTRVALARPPRVAPAPLPPAAQMPLLSAVEPVAPVKSVSHVSSAPPDEMVATPDMLARVLPASPQLARDAVLSRPRETATRYLFETFIVGTTNRLAYAAAQEVAQNPGERYNPLLIYGGVGLGKTHLLHAIGHLTHQRGLSVAYVTAEQFTNEIIEAIRLRATDAFRARYREVDVLLVDDIQFIAGKESTEEEFFHTFNALHEANKQIVLSSDRVPQAMRQLHDRLRSRFEWGLIADIQPPDYEHRLAILRAKAATLPTPLTDETLASLARPEHESIRALEGALTRAMAYARMLEQPLTPRLVADALAPLADSSSTRPVEPAQVLAAVAEHYHFTVAELQSKSRERAIARARQIAMYLLREETPTSLAQIGQQLGGRDHTTVMHGCAHIAQALAQDDTLRREIGAIRAALHG